MTTEVANKIFNAINSAGIKNFEVLTDGSFIHMRNNDFDTIKWNGSNTLICIRSEKMPGATAFPGNVRVSTIDVEQIEEIRIGGDAKDMLAYAEALGFSLEDDEIAKVNKINSMNRSIIPPTGDYFNFNYLTEEEYEQLTPEEKEEYDKRKTRYESYKSEHYMGQPGKFVNHVEY